jgi:hypothetical protein
LKSILYTPFEHLVYAGYGCINAYLVVDEIVECNDTPDER